MMITANVPERMLGRGRKLSGVVAALGPKSATRELSPFKWV